MTTIHELKTWPHFYKMVEFGEKKFEYRKNDRGFKTGDVLRLKEFDPVMREYTGHELSAKVTCVVDDAPGLPPEYCIMGIEVAPWVYDPAIDEEFDGMSVRWEDLDHSHDGE